MENLAGNLRGNKKLLQKRGKQLRRMRIASDQMEGFAVGTSLTVKKISLNNWKKGGKWQGLELIIRQILDECKNKCNVLNELNKDGIEIFGEYVQLLKEALRLAQKYVNTRDTPLRNLSKKHKSKTNARRKLIGDWGEARGDYADKLAKIKPKTKSQPANEEKPMSAIPEYPSEDESSESSDSAEDYYSSGRHTPYGGNCSLNTPPTTKKTSLIIGELPPKKIGWCRSFFCCCCCTPCLNGSNESDDEQDGNTSYQSFNQE